MAEAGKPLRTWVYRYEPSHYGMSCDCCGGDRLAWSEFKHLVWCYDCELDTPGKGSIFDGPIPFQMTRMMLGRDCFDRVYLKTGIVETYEEWSRKAQELQESVAELELSADELESLGDELMPQKKVKL